MAERLTAERLAEIRLCLAGDPEGLLLSGRTDEAAALMRECDAADEVLRAAGLLEADRG